MDGQSHSRPTSLSGAAAGLAVAICCLFIGATPQAAPLGRPSSTTVCEPALLAIDGNRIWANAAGAGPATVVFEAGFGNDSSVWAGVEPRIRAGGARTLVYDRAGMGRSTINTRLPYSLDNDAHILRTLLSRCGVSGPVLFVGHSYGGAIGLWAAARDSRIKALVLLDALVPGVGTPGEVAKNLKAMRPQYAQIRREEPALAKVAIPWAEAMARTAREVNTMAVSERLPITDIVAEKGQSDPETAKVWRGAHVAFTAGHSARSLVVAEQSSHKVMVDKPDLVVNAILAMLKRVEGASPQ